MVEPQLTAAFDWRGIKARSIVAHGWAWQRTHLPAFALTSTPAGRIFSRGAPQNLDDFASEDACFDYDFTEVKAVAKVLGVRFTADTLVEALLQLIVAIKHCSETMAFMFMQKRLARVASKDWKAARRLSELDEAAKCLVPGDVEVLKKQQERAEEQKQEHKHFVSEYRRVRKAVRARAEAKAAPAKGRGRGKGRGGAAPPPPARPALPASFAMMPQHVAKGFMPPGAKLRKRRSDATWHGRVGCMPEVSRGW